MKVFGGRRLALTFCDQGVSSTSNFVTGVAVAHVSGLSQFGAYMLTYTLWLIVVGCHRALLTEPIVVTTRERDDRDLVVAHGVSAESVLGAAISCAAGVIGLLAFVLHSQLATPMLALAPWFPALLVQDYWRAMSFQQRRPEWALASDGLFTFVQISAIAVFWVLGWRSAGYMIAAWGIGASMGALLGLLWFPASASPNHGLRLVRRLWPTGRWMLADFLTGFTSGQAYLIFVALLLTGAEYGGFRAAFSLLGPVMVILLAGGNIGLPEAARRFDPDDLSELRHLARRLSAAAFGCIALVGMVMAVAGRQLLKVLYGPAFSRFGLLATLAAVQYMAIALVFGQEQALKAAGRMQRLWRVRAAIGAASLTAVYVLVQLLGINGAGWAGAATGAFYAAGLYWVYFTEIVRPGHRHHAPSSPDPADINATPVMHPATAQEVQT